MRPFSEDGAASAEADAAIRVAPEHVIDAVLSSLLSRLDAEQTRAFVRKMAELDVERQQRH